jgi:hypothetical protein
MSAEGPVHGAPAVSRNRPLAGLALLHQPQKPRPDEEIVITPYDEKKAA